MKQQRKIIHIDMDAFFAAIEQHDNPRLRGRPVIVGGDPAGRGVVSACSYEARQFGVHSAMACARAQRLCPRAIFIRPRMERYKEVSRQIMRIFYQVTDLVEPLSMDEAFLDVTVNKLRNPSATWIAEDIRRRIFRETGLTASAGVSCNKFLAKIASDLNKPNGIKVITPQEMLPFIGSLPVGKFYGVGKVTEQKMLSLGIRTGGDLRRLSKAELLRYFGNTGLFFYHIVRGEDNRPVNPYRIRKSIGSETTMAKDVRNRQEMLDILVAVAERVEAALRKNETGGRTITLKVRYGDFSTVTRSRTIRYPVYTAREIIAFLPDLLADTEAGRKAVRLLGVTVSKLTIDEESTGPRYRQLCLPFGRMLSPQKAASLSRDKETDFQLPNKNGP